MPVAPSAESRRVFYGKLVYTMFHKAFTLIEILVVIALIGIVATVSVVSLSAGQGAAKLKGAARDAYAALRQARSIALVSQKPCVITFSTETRNEEAYSKITLTSAKLMNGIDVPSAETISGEIIPLDGDEEMDAAANSSQSGTGKGHSIEEVLFQDVSEDLLTGVRFYIEGSSSEGEFESEGAQETKKASISVFSNVDYLLASYKKKTASESENEAKEDDDGLEASSDSVLANAVDTPPTSFVWQSNGRTEAQKIYVYLDGEKPEQGILIKVDKFGGISLVSPGEDSER